MIDSLNTNHSSASIPESGVRNPFLQAKGHVTALDGLRGLAILVVLFHHIWPYIWSHPAYSLLSTIKHVGWIGVDLFFVLSGFLITGILLDSRERPHFLRNFIARRSLRVFPLYYFFLLLCFAVVPSLLNWLRPDAATTHESQLSSMWFTTYTANYLPLLSDPTISASLGHTGELKTANLVPDYLAVTWSLCVEEQFYLLWPLLILVLGGRVSIRLVAGLILFMIMCRSLVVLRLPDWQQITYVTTFCRGDGLLIGSAMAIGIRHVSFNQQYWRLLVRVAALVVLPCAALWIVKSGGRGNATFAALGYTLLAIGFAGWLGLAISTRRGWTRQFLELPVLRWFGRHSYGLYLYHMVIVALFQAWRPAVMSAGGNIVDPSNFQPIGGSILVDAPIRTMMIIGVSMIVAWTSFRFLESPFLRLKDLFGSDPSPGNDTAFAAPPYAVVSTRSTIGSL